MITGWRIKNFKSIKDQPEIPLSNINILAGANSSGKSSIIQSILLLKQTVQYGAESRHIVLNGPLLRLGAFEDIKNSDAPTEQDLRIGLSFKFNEIDLRSPAAWMRSVSRVASAHGIGMLESVSIDLSYRGGQRDLLPDAHGASLPTLTPELASSEIKHTFKTISPSPIKRNGYAHFSNQKPVFEEDDKFAPGTFGVKLDSDSIAELSSGRPDAKILWSYMNHFLPSYISIYYNTTTKQITNALDYIFEPGFFGHSGENAGFLIDRNAVELINSWIIARSGQNNHVTLNVFEEINASQARNALRPYIRNDIIRHDSKTIAQKTADAAALKAELMIVMLRDAQADFDTDFELPRSLGTASEYLRNFLKYGVRYLGPLRDSPRPVYQPEALESTTDVGYRGEHTAAVLDLNRSKRVLYRRPPNDPDLGDFVAGSKQHRATLHEAVVEWLSYLGVAANVDTMDVGVYGNRLRVTTHPSGELHDLTNVGVGVSQILPLVVMALLAPQGSFLIFEQPELHLHPKVQARLADFFLSLSLENKQILLETHSEYLVDRFRLRIALSDDDLVRPLVSIFFSEKVGNESRLTPVDISEYGAITNWPKDFFEQSQRDINRIIKAASSKRRARQEKI